MRQRWLDILTPAEQRDLGRTLVRLAQMAESVHHRQRVEALLQDDMQDPATEGLSGGATEGAPQGKEAWR